MKKSVFLKIKYYAVAVLAIFASVCFAAFLSPISGSASAVALPTVYSPLSALESFSLNSPQDVFYCENYTAIIEGTTKLTVYSTEIGEISFDDAGFSALKQVKGLSSDKLLVLDYNKIKIADLTARTATELRDVSDSTLTCNFFDVAGDRLITVSGSPNGVVKVYDISDLAAIRQINGFDGVDGDSPVCLNAENIFFVKSSALYKTPINSLLDETLLSTVSVCKKMIANESTVYYVSGGNVINSLSVAGGSISTLTTNSDFSDYDLGYIPNGKEISGLCFKGANILAAVASDNYVSEFAVSGGKLEFTGYAIASGKTAYNRIGADASDIEVSASSIAAIDGVKLTVIKSDADGYDKNDYFNAFFDSGSLTGFVPDAFALGSSTALLAEKSTGKLKIVNCFVSGTENLISFETAFVGGNNIADVCYSAGVYYILKIAEGSGADVSLYTLTEKSSVLSPALITLNGSFGLNSCLAADINGNVYVSSADGTQIFYVNKDADGAYIAPDSAEFVGTTPAKKLAVDLSGACFAVTDDDVYFYENGAEHGSSILLSNVKSFALSFETKSVYFINEGSERISVSDRISNMSADGITIPEGFDVRPTEADIENLKIYGVNSGETLFTVSDDGGTTFSYGNIYHNFRNEYVKVSDCVYAPNGRESVQFSILIGYNEDNNPVTVAVKTSALTQLSDATADCETETVFATTGVSLYYLPIITETDDFTLMRDGETLRVERGAEFSVLKTVRFLGKDFYYVSYVIGDDTLNGYVPTDFTVETLYNDVPVENITDATAEDNGHALRNALIVIICATSVFATSLFFIVRKKEL